jgi:membrane associated rhomboid family serine protease
MTNRFRYLFKGKISFERLIASVVIVTGAIWLLYFLALIFDAPTGHFWRYFALPGDWHSFIKQPWSLLTYAWIHTGLVGFFINLLLLYYLGNLFLTFFDEKKMMRLFWTGIIAGGLGFLLSYRFIPYLYKDEPNALLTGISSGYVIWLAYSAEIYGHHKVHLSLLGQIKIKHIFVFFLILDLLMLNLTNSGGHTAHLVSMAAGWIIATWESKRTAKKFRVVRNEPKIYDNLKTSTEKRIDRILDKINESGFDSLTAEEKEILYRESERNK